jgi:hypothetical protein
MNKIQWTEDERLALQAIDNSNSTLSMQKPGASVRLYEQGYVLKDSCGKLALSESGKALLSALRRTNKY